MRFFAIFSFIFISCSSLYHRGTALEHSNVQHYLPKLNVFDNYDECKNRFDDFIYCAVDVTIKPDATNPTWRQIEEINRQHKSHFRHDRLQRGYCLQDCQDRIDRMVDPQRYQFIEEPLLEKKQKFRPDIFANNTYFKRKYGCLMNVCANEELTTQFGLKGHSVIDYCITKDSLTSDYTDRWDILIYSVFAVLIVVVILASLSDQQGTQSMTKLYEAFSLTRNWRLLTTSRKTNPADDIKFIDSIRFLLTNQLVLMHASFLIISLPGVNPDYLEGLFQTFGVRASMNAVLIVQSFFFVSGFLQVRNFLLERNTAFGMSYFWRTLASRYLRLSSVVVAVIFLDSTFLFKHSEGPFWPRLADPQRHFCRKNWWKTLLYINNYTGRDELCVQHSWYLAANYQLYALGLALLWLIFKFPKKKLQILTWTLVASFALPGLVTYVQNFDGVPIFDLESFKYCFWYSRDYKEAYIPTHMNLGNYFMGFAFGYFMDWVKRSSFDISRYTLFRLGWYTCIPLQVLTIMSGSVFYETEFSNPSFYAAAYAVSHKFVWAVLNVLFIWGLMSNCGSFFKTLLDNKVLSCMGKLSYCVYLIHMTIARVIMGYNLQPIYFHEKGMSVINVTLLLYSYGAALMLCLCVEYPIINLQRLMSDKFKMS